MLGRLVLRASSRLGAAKAGTGIFGRSTTTSSRLAVSRLTVSGDAKVSSRVGGLWPRGFASGGAAKKPPLKAASVATACTTSDKTVKKLLSSMDYTGTALFAFTGTLKAAVLGQMDLLGCTLVGFTTAVGGGTVRDFMLGNTPVFWLRQPQYIALGVLSSLATFFAFPILRKGKGLEFTETEQQVLDWADSICLGAFCVVGAMSATKAGLHWLVVPVVGMVTSTFGGIIRDLLCRQKPWVCHTDSGLYATTALGGATAFTTCTNLVRLPIGAAIGAGVTTCVFLRYLSFGLGHQLPTFASWTSLLEETTNKNEDASPEKKKK